MTYLCALLVNHYRHNSFTSRNKGYISYVFKAYLINSHSLSKKMWICVHSTPPIFKFLEPYRFQISIIFISIIWQVKEECRLLNAPPIPPRSSKQAGSSSATVPYPPAKPRQTETRSPSPTLSYYSSGLHNMWVMHCFNWLTGHLVYVNCTTFDWTILFFISQ